MLRTKQYTHFYEVYIYNRLINSVAAILLLLLLDAKLPKALEQLNDAAQGLLQRVVSQFKVQN